MVRNSLTKKDDLPLDLLLQHRVSEEGGSYGKDTKGTIRQHQFYKVELVSIVEPKDCLIELDRMLTVQKKF